METKNPSAVKPGLPNPQTATFTLLIYFKDGNKRIFYSYHTAYDAELKKVIVNDKVSLNKLIRQVQFKFKTTFKTAIIYHKETNKQLYKWVNDRLIQEHPYQFQFLNNAVKILIN